MPKVPKLKVHNISSALMVQLRNCQRPSVLQLHGELLSSPHSSDSRCQPAIQNIADEIDTRQTTAIVFARPFGTSRINHQGNRSSGCKCKDSILVIGHKNEKPSGGRGKKGLITSVNHEILSQSTKNTNPSPPELTLPKS